MNLMDEVRSIMRIQGTDHDQFLDVMVPILEEHVREHCNNQFTKDSYGNTVLPGPAKLFIAKAAEYNMQKAGLKERSMGSVSYSYDLQFPDSLYKYLRPYKRLKFIANR